MANTYAVITNNAVTTCFVGDDAFATAAYPGSVRIDNLNPVPGIGWAYLNGTFTAPAQTAPATTSSPIFRRTDFLRLLTDAEIQTILNYSSSTTLTAPQKLAVSEFVEYFRDADMVDVTSPTTVSGINLLAALGLLTSARAAAILASRN